MQKRVARVWRTNSPVESACKRPCRCGLPDYEREQGPLGVEVRGRVLQMSAATMDRLLAPCRVSLGSRGRLGEAAQAERLNDLYVQEWNLFRNFYCPLMKHVRTEVEGSRKRRIYDHPATPFERLKASAGADPRQIERLEALQATLHPLRAEAAHRKEIAPGAPADRARPSPSFAA